uniref:Uncharacterized protein n=1 Tax=Cacopsylla melanoneura TaxID=428564 RepID=A0A8D9EKM4_9HEMI
MYDALLRSVILSWAFPQTGVGQTSQLLTLNSVLFNARTTSLTSSSSSCTCSSLPLSLLVPAVPALMAFQRPRKCVAGSLIIPQQMFISTFKSKALEFRSVLLCHCLHYHARVLLYPQQL